MTPAELQRAKRAPVGGPALNVPARYTVTTWDQEWTNLSVWEATNRVQLLNAEGIGSVLSNTKGVIATNPGIRFKNDGGRF